MVEAESAEVAPVADIAADGSGVAYLGAAHHVHGVPKHGYVFLDQGIVGDMGKRSACAYPQIAVVKEADSL